MCAVTVVLVLIGAAEAKELRFRIVDADSGEPVANIKIKQFVSMWQPRILLPPGRFWFPNGVAATDASGFASIENRHSDDVYYLDGQGYESGRVTRNWFKYKFSSGTKDPYSPLAEVSGVIVVPLRRSGAKQPD